MPEWKSFTVGEGGQAMPEPASAPAAAPRAMEADEYAAKWGTEVEDVSIPRIVKVLEGDGLPHGFSEFIAVTQLEDVRFQIHREPVDAPWLQIETRISLEGEGHTEHSLQAIANRWNTEHLQPTVMPIEDEGTWVLVAASRFFVGEGLSDRQIHAMLRRGLVIGLSAARELPGMTSEASEQYGTATHRHAYRH